MADNLPSATRIASRRAPRQGAHPSDWSLRTTREPSRSRNRPDAVWFLAPPDGETAEFAVAAKRSVTPRGLPDLIEQLRTDAAEPFIAAPYLGRARKACSQKWE